MPTKAAPLFTIVIPVTGRRVGLVSSVQSVLGQSVSDFELLLVVLDGEDAAASGESLAGTVSDPRLTWVDAGDTQSPLGDAIARRARGQLLSVLPCGDIILHDHLERFALFFARPKLQWACSRPIWVRDDGLLVPFFGNLTFGSAALHFRRGSFVPPGAVVYRRSLREAVGRLADRGRGNADWALWQAMFKRLTADAIAHVRDPTQLHFKPADRDAAQWAPRPMPYLGALADSSEFWPSALRLRLKPEARAGAIPDQAWARISDDPARFARRLRRATAELQDEIAWTAVTAQPFFKAV